MLIRQSNTTAAALEVLSNDGLNVAFGQFGEDVVALSILMSRKRLNIQGFYVDVGAHHPWQKSNTALLSHFKNWRGINIDANAEAIELFDQERPKDVNICAAISDEIVDADYTMFNRAGVNTLDPVMSEKQANASHGAYKIERVVKMTTRRLDDIFDKHVPTGKEIDFMSVDIEGFDFKALKSNNWEKYKPFLIAIETHGMNLADLPSNEIYAFLSNHGYRLISHCFVTSIFIRT